jgi:hypothetical protein
MLKGFDLNQTAAGPAVVAEVRRVQEATTEQTILPCL